MMPGRWQNISMISHSWRETNFTMVFSHRIKALSHLRENACILAQGEINKALKALDQVPKGDIHYFLTQQMAGIILFRNRAYDQARDRLIPVLEYFQSISSDLCTCENLFNSGINRLGTKGCRHGILPFEKGI